MMTPRYALPAALFLMLLASPAAPQGYSPEERGSNWVRSTYQFGAVGTSPGQLLEPRAVAVGRDNLVYVSDTGNHRIQTFSIDGKPLSTWGGAGTAEGKFLFPSGLALGPDGQLFVADAGNHRVQVFDEKGKLLRTWGRHGLRPGEFSSPRWIAVAKDRVVVVESDCPRVQVFTLQGEPVRSFGGYGEGPGRFREPAGVAADEQGNLYVADAGAHQIQKFDPQGKPLIQWGSWGSPPALLSSPAGLAFGDGKLYVADGGNHRVQVFDASGTFLYQWGRHPAFAHEGSGRLHFPSGIAVSPSGGFTVLCEPLEHRVQAFSIGSARAVRPMNDLPWWDSLHARFHLSPRKPEPHGEKPTALVAMRETDAPAVLFFDLEPKLPSFLGRAGGAGKRMGEFGTPAGLALDAFAGRLYVSERANRRIQILELPRDPKTPTGFAPHPRVISAWDLASAIPWTVDGVSLDRLQPGALALDPSGTLHLLDEGNCVIHLFDRRMNYLRTLLPPKDEGPRRWIDLAFAPDGESLVVLDRDGARVVVLDRKGGVIASWGSRGSGEGEFLLPAGIGVGQDGTVYVSDSGAHRVLRFDARGKFQSMWGAFGRDPGHFYSPRGIVIAGRDRIVVDDAGNHRGQIFDRDGKLVELFHKGGVPAQPAPPK